MSSKRSGQHRKRKASAAPPRRQRDLASRRAPHESGLSAGEESVRIEKLVDPAARVEPTSTAADPTNASDAANAFNVSISVLTKQALRESDTTGALPIGIGGEGPVDMEAALAESDEAEQTPAQITRAMPSTARKYPTLANMAAVAPQPARAMATDRLDESTPTTENGPSPVSSPHWARPADSLAARKWAALEAREASVQRALTAKDALERLEPIGADDEPQTLHARGRPLAGGNIVLAVAACQAALVAVAALVGALLLIDHQSLAIWAWIFAGIAGLGGWLAYAIGQDEQAQTFAGGILLVSQVGMLGWAFAVVGPRASLLAVVPPLMLLALRMAGRAAATVWVIVMLVIYAVFLIFAAGLGLQPAVRLDASAGALLDGILVCSGLVLTLAGLLRIGERLIRLEAMARMRGNEARLLRARVVTLQRRAAEDAERLYELSDATMRGRQHDIAPLDPALRPVTERLRATAVRMAAMREEHAAHQQQEAALRRLTRALERGWLGLHWAWPKPSGTPVDQLMALLRAPHAHDEGTHRANDSSTPQGLMHLPTSSESIAREGSQLESGGLRAAVPGATTGEYAQARTQPLPIPPRANAPLRWEEWDEWREWQLKHD